MINQITIILPVRNESNYIRSCLQSVLNQRELHVPIIVIVSDGMSTDGTREIVNEIRRVHPNLVLIDNPGMIVSTGMNLALRIATGDVIIRVDGHCIIEPDYISKSLKYLLEKEVDGVGGPMQSIGETQLSEAIALAMSSTFGVGNSAFRTTTGKTMLVDTIPFPAYTRAITERAGFYDEELVRNQDDEYNYRIRELGGKLLLADDIRSKYYSRGSLQKLWKQYFQYGFYKVRVLQKHPKQMSLRQFVPLTFVITLLASIALLFSYSWGWIPFTLLAGSYMIANLVASIKVSRSKGWKHLLQLPMVFAILHFSYGSGFLIGLFKFWNRWGDKIGKIPTK